MHNKTLIRFSLCNFQKDTAEQGDKCKRNTWKTDKELISAKLSRHLKFIFNDISDVFLEPMLMHSVDALSH